MTETSGAVSAPNQHSLEAAAEMFARGGNAVDAAVAAQVVVAVTMPQSAGVGGDMLALVRLPDGPAGPSDPAGPVSPDGPDGPVRALNGTGRSPAHWTTCGNGRPGDTVTVPGAVLGWWELCRAFGRLPCADVLAPALRLARDGIVVDERLAGAAAKQRDRVLAASPDSPIGDLTRGVTWRQPQLAALLQRIADEGPAAFYEGAAANAIAAAAERAGGSLAAADLAAHLADPPALKEPIAIDWAGGRAYVQPPSSQGVLLAMALRWLDDRFDDLPTRRREHVLAELTNACFAHRSDCALGEQLLDRELPVDPERATLRTGPRSYLHTAAVATADSDGLVVSSLVSVFDEFGSGVWVPELGIYLTNRAEGFTDGANAPAPGSLPVHTLAPALWESDHEVLAIATPGADGQVQTLLQVFARLRDGATLAEAIAGPRWRSEDGRLRIETDHDARDQLADAGHELQDVPAGSPVFGAVAAAGLRSSGPFAVADPRRAMRSAIVARSVGDPGSSTL